MKVINKFKASNAGHKDMLAVLAAVTEVRRDECQIFYSFMSLTNLRRW